MVRMLGVGHGRTPDTATSTTFERYWQTCGEITTASLYQPNPTEIIALPSQQWISEEGGGKIYDERKTGQDTLHKAVLLVSNCVHTRALASAESVERFSKTSPGVMERG